MSTHPDLTNDLSTGRHPVHVAHLILGVVFVGLTLVWALVASDAVALGDIRWLLPIPWIAAGAAGLAAIVLRQPAQWAGDSTPR